MSDDWRFLSVVWFRRRALVSLQHNVAIFPFHRETVARIYPHIEVKVDLIVNMPRRCAYLPVLLDNRMLAVLVDLSVQLHDVVGDMQVAYHTSSGDSTGMA